MCTVMYIWLTEANQTKLHSRRSAEYWYYGGHISQEKVATRQQRKQHVVNDTNILIVYILAECATAHQCNVIMWSGNQYT